MSHEKEPASWLEVLACTGCTEWTLTTEGLRRIIESETAPLARAVADAVNGRDEAWAKDARWESFLRNVCEALDIEKPPRCSNPEPSGEWEARVLAAIERAKGS